MGGWLFSADLAGPLQRIRTANTESGKSHTLGVELWLSQADEAARGCRGSTFFVVHGPLETLRQVGHVEFGSKKDPSYSLGSGGRHPSKGLIPPQNKEIKTQRHLHMLHMHEQGLATSGLTFGIP